MTSDIEQRNFADKAGLEQFWDDIQAYMTRMYKGLPAGMQFSRIYQQNGQLHILVEPFGGDTLARKEASRNSLDVYSKAEIDANYKTKQDGVSEQFTEYQTLLDISQDTNGEISLRKQVIPTAAVGTLGLTTLKGVVSANDSDNSNAATPKAVADAIAATIAGLDVSEVSIGEAKTVGTISEVDGKIVVTAVDILVGNSNIADGAVTNDKLGEDSVTTDKIADGTIQSGDIGAGQVTETNIATDAVTESKIHDAAVTTNKLANDAVTADKVKDGETLPVDISGNAATATTVKEGGELDQRIGALESGKADKVSNATADNFASLDANGNLKDSGHKHSDYKTVQEPVSDPETSGNTDNFEFISSVEQNPNGLISATKHTIPKSNAIDSDSSVTLATSAAVKAAVEHAQSGLSALDVENHLRTGEYITTLSQTDGLITYDTEPMATEPVENGTAPVTSHALYVEKHLRETADTHFEELIPTQASANNQLVDKAYVDAIGTRLEARYLSSYSEELDEYIPFPTHADFVAAQSSGDFYYNGTRVNKVDNNDVIVITADETHLNEAGGPSTTRYRYQCDVTTGQDGNWYFEYVINNTALNLAQLQAINSGINADKVNAYDTHIASDGKEGRQANPHSVTFDQLEGRNGVTSTELGVLDGVDTSSVGSDQLNTLAGIHIEEGVTIQSQLNGKAERVSPKYSPEEDPEYTASGKIAIIDDHADVDGRFGVADSGAEIVANYNGNDTINPATGSAIKEAIDALDTTVDSTHPGEKVLVTVTETDGLLTSVVVDDSNAATAAQGAKADTAIQTVSVLDNGDQSAHILEPDANNGVTVDLSDYKRKQDPVVNPTAQGTSLTFIDTISQDDEGVITPTRKSVTVDNDYNVAGTNPASGTAITNALHTLDATVDSTGGNNVGVQVVETNGKITGVTVSDSSINATDLSTAINALDATVATETAGTPAEGKNFGISVSEENGVLTGVSIIRDDTVNATDVSNAISSVLNDLNADVTSSDGTNVQVNVTEVAGVITGVNITTDNTVNATDVANKVATEIGKLDVDNITGFGAGKTLASLTETDGKIAATFQSILVDTANIKPDAVQTAQIADDAVTSDKIKEGEVKTANIADDAVTSDKLDAGAVTSEKIGEGEVKTINIDDEAVTTAKIVDEAVTTAKIDDSAVTTAKITDSAVTTAKIDDSAVTTAKINDGAVTTDKIADDAVTNDKIADNAVDTAQINAGAVTYDKVTNDPENPFPIDISGNADTATHADDASHADVADIAKDVQEGSSLDQRLDTIEENISDLDNTKADKVANAVSGNFAGLNANGNLTDSGVNANTFKTKQTAVTKTGAILKTLTSLTQNVNGEIDATFSDIQSATTTQKGVVQLAGTIGATVASENNKAASEKAVRDAIDNALENTIDSLDVEEVGGAGKYISAISETDGKISATVTDMDTAPTSASTNAVTSGGVYTAINNAVNALDATVSDSSTNVSVSVTETNGKLTSITVTDTAATSNHIHGNITNDGKVGSDANKVLVTTTGGTVAAGNIDGTYNASTNKIATQSTVTNAINALDVSNISGFGADKTLATLAETDGKITASFQSIQIAESQVTGLEDDLEDIDGALETKEDKANKVTSWSATTTDTRYPSEKLVKDSLDTKVDKTTKVNGHALSSDVTVTKGDVGLGNVVNTGDSDTPVENGTTKFTTGGAYTELNKKADKTATVSNVAYDGTNKKITKTINGTTSDVVTAATLKADMALDKVKNQAITVTSTSVSDGTNTFNKYVHPTTTAVTAAAVKVGKDELGHVELGEAITKDDIGLGKVKNQAITVTSTSVSDGTNTFNKYVHPTTTAVTAAAVKVGKDELGHVVIGGALTKSDVDLGNVDNTSDANKPVSTAQQTALNAKLDKTAGVTAVTWDSTNKKITKTINGTTSDVVTAATLKTAMALDNVTNDAQVKRSEMGVANGVATLDNDGKVPASQLPSYIDDVIEGYYDNGAFYEDSSHTVEIPPESGKVYVDKTTNLTYRWSGTAYVKIASDLALGETESTAYRGDRGKTAYDHSQLTSGNPHNVTKTDVGLGNVVNTGDSSTPVSGGTTKFTTGGAYTELNKKADKTATVSNVAWDATNKKLTKTINGTTSDVVTASTIKTALGLTKSDVGLGNVDNTSDDTKKTNFTGAVASGNTGFPTGDMVYQAIADGKECVVVTVDTPYSEVAAIVNADKFPVLKYSGMYFPLTLIVGGGDTTNYWFYSTRLGNPDDSHTSIIIRKYVCRNANPAWASPSDTYLQNNAELVSSWSTTVSNSRYPSEKLVKTSLDKKVDKVDGMGLSSNDYTTEEKTKLAGIAAGAEVNQNAFSNVKVGSTTVAADSKTDTLELVAGPNVTITPDATNDKITIAATDTTYESKAATSGGTDVSLVTTGEKYTWNSKQDALAAQTAYTSKGTATKVPQITTNALGQVTGITEITITGVTPASHTHGNITNAGAIGTASGQAVYTTTNGVLTAGSLATTDPAAEGNALEFIATVSQDAKGKITATKKSVTVDSTYSSTGTNPVNGKAIAAAIGTLDVTAITGGTGKTITSISETDGKISATYSDISITKSQVSDFAHTHGNITNAGGITADAVTVASGDAIVVVDSSDTSKKVVKSSISFDGSTTTQALTKAGTWATFNNYSHPAGSAPSVTGFPTAGGTLSFGGTFDVNQVSTDSTSHVSAITKRTFTLPSLGTTSTTAAKGDHTHTTSIASDSTSGATVVSLSANAQYKITAGGTSVIFKTPVDTTYTSKTAVSGGTEVSLVTTGEKWTWNHKQDALTEMTTQEVSDLVAAFAS